MAINAIEPPKSPALSLNLKGGDTNSCRLIKIDFGPDEFLTTANSRGKLKKLKDSRSPYVAGDRVQLLSRVTERKIIHKKGSDFKSSFPLATNIYKASSDEFKAVKRINNRKVKKSVLTLPNEPAPMPQVCTVSDVNDSEYLERNNGEQRANTFSKNTRKRIPLQNKKDRVRRNNFEFYDRDARHCSQLDLDCSSTDVIKHVNGDGNRVSSKAGAGQKTSEKEEFNAHDVWAVLRNINRFQFKPSPHISEESYLSPKRKKGCNRRRKNRQERRVIETRRTQEIAYIADFQVDSNSPTTLSQANSIDRVTVINNGDPCKKTIRTQNLRRRRLSPKQLNQLLDTVHKDVRTNFKPLGIKCGQTVPTNKIFQEKNKDYGKMNSYKSKESVSSVYKDSVDSSNYYRFNRNSESSEKTYTIRPKHTNAINGSSILDSFLRDDQQNAVNKEVLNNEPKTVTNNAIESQSRKPRLVTTMPSGAVMPKLTTADIKRRLAHMKFPLVILGKDQISSAIKINDYEAPQFNGLDKHIWPFMVEWSENKNKTYKRIPSSDRTTNQLRKPNDVILSKLNDKKCNTDVTSKKKVEHKRGLSNIDNNVATPQPKRSKPMQQFKDKMLRLLYKKSGQKLIEIKNQLDSTDNFRCNVIHKLKEVKQADASTETYQKVDLPKELHATPEAISMRMNYFLNNAKRPLTKRKSASEFIDNVIRKIKNGSYYSHVEKSYSKEKYNVDHREVSIQTYLSKKVKENPNRNGPYDQCVDLIPKITNLDNTYDPLKAIPGFDDTLSALEIKSLNFNQISVKHCLTNVVVQFDVTVLGKESVTVDVKKSISCIPTEMTDSLIPISETESHSRIFKCRTSILNAVLPAEICSVLPKIMRNIAEGTLGSPPVDQNRSSLSIISELTQSEGPCRIKLLPIWITPELRKYQDGQFSSKNKIRPSKTTFNDPTRWTFNYDVALISELLLKPIVKPLFCNNVNPLKLRLPEPKEVKTTNPSPYTNDQLSGTRMSNCTAVQLYTNSNRRLFPAFQKLNFLRMMEHLLSYRNFHLNLMPTFIYPTKMICGMDNITVNMVVEYNEAPKKMMTVTISKLKIDSLFNGYLKRNAPKDKIRPKINVINASAIKSIEYNSELFNNKLVKRNNRVPGFNNKIKRKGFVKLYKRCKSTSNIPGERSCTPLSKITNLDDFFQVLGPGKMMSSVFDGCAGQKLITSIFEMRSWITDITQRQAMLVLLLTNKKDTPNLMRFRPILLQGIAVNRITRANELDMEIEVIEKEHLNKLSQYDGIPYLPSAVVNDGNLLEELIWIAKTTASDYQRHFDESSERLLKSLLEKRKKLNPSYLRVMARYVGLGLLKPPNKKYLIS